MEGGGLPVHHGASVQGHEENLTAASRTHRGEEHLEERDTHTHTRHQDLRRPKARCDEGLTLSLRSDRNFRR